MLASTPSSGRLPCQCLFSRSVLLLGRFVPAILRGAFVTTMLVDRRPSAFDIGLVVVSAVGFIVVFPWCACL